MIDHGSTLSDLTTLLAAANRMRGWRDGSDPGIASGTPDAEERLEALFGISRRLAVYGTLAPGKPNHHVVAPLGGEWTNGIVEGDLSEEGWGATLGYPAFRPRAGGAVIAVQVLTSSALPAAWPEIDRFEGPEYRRILVPVFHSGPPDGRRLYTVANLYAAADPRDAGGVGAHGGEAGVDRNAGPLPDTSR